LNNNGLTGKVQTVLGAVDGACLGITSTHEHIIWDMSTYFEEPAAASDRRLARQPVSMENLHLIRPRPHINIDNMMQADERLAVSELMHFKLAGGGTMLSSARKAWPVTRLPWRVYHGKRASTSSWAVATMWLSPTR